MLLKLIVVENVQSHIFGEYVHYSEANQCTKLPGSPHLTFEMYYIALPIFDEQIHEKLAHYEMGSKTKCT